jgi:ketosteroid isomerase-like protein
MQAQEWDAAVKRFLAEYIDAFLSNDGARIARTYNVPCVSVRVDGSICAFQSGDELKSFFQGLAEAYSKAGSRRWHYENLHIEALGAQSAIATLDWEMQREDGSAIRRWRQTYNFVLKDQRLRILASTFHLA